MVFVQVDDEVTGEWRQWMQRVHIPDVMKTGAFTAVDFDYDRAENTHLICYHCKSAAALERYFAEHASRLQTEHSHRYRGRFRAWRYVMRPVKANPNEGLYA